MHDQIITYNLQDSIGNSMDFQIKNMNDIYDKFNGIIDAPHRHNYFTIIVNELGKGTHIIDFKKFNITDYSIHFVYPGQVHQVYTTSRPTGWVMNFTMDFLLKHHIRQDLINQVYLFNTYGDSPPLQLDRKRFDRFSEIIKQLKHYSNQATLLSSEAIGAVLKLFFIDVVGTCTVKNSDVAKSGLDTNNLMVKFKSLIESKFNEYHKVIDYANELFVSSDYLNKYVKSQTNKSAKEFIQEKLIVEAKRLLLFTDETNKELAYKLGFDEPSHFSNFFKKLTNQTPGEFRIQSRL